MANNFDWTPEAKDRFRKMWSDGEKTAAIARAFGVTVSAVTGLRARMNLPARDNPVNPETRYTGFWTPERNARFATLAKTHNARQMAAEFGRTVHATRTHASTLRITMAAINTGYRRGPAPTPSKPPMPDPAPRAAPAKPTILPPPMSSLKPTPAFYAPQRTCQFITGHPGHGPWSFCGYATAPGRPYCQPHVELCYQPLRTSTDHD